MMSREQAKKLFEELGRMAKEYNVSFAIVQQPKRMGPATSPAQDSQIVFVDYLTKLDVAFEAGYKACERGLNIQAAKEEFLK